MITWTVGRSLLISILLLAVPVTSQAQDLSIGVAVGVPPPPLPVYSQPEWPGDGYLWVPGYWAYADETGYYWVPGTWTLAPEPGLLWTPGYWAWQPEGFMWNAGYWGPHVGFYGGIDYGFGYFGTGFSGGYWANNTYFCNGAVTNIGALHGWRGNVYYGRGGFNEAQPNRISYNGGDRGTRSHPTLADLTARREPHIGWTTAQRQQASMARSNPALAAATNHGFPPIAATPRAGLFSGRNVSSAHGSELSSGPSRATAAFNGRDLSLHVGTGANGRFTPSYGGGRNGTMRTPPSNVTEGARSDRPPWASGQPGRPGTVAAASGSYESHYRTTRGNAFPSPDRGAPPSGSSRYASTAPYYTGPRAWAPATGRVPSGDSRYGAYRPASRLPAAGSAQPGSGRWAGGYQNPSSGASSRTYYAGSPAQNRGTPARTPYAAGAYGGGAPVRFNGGGSAHATYGPQNRAPGGRH